MGMILPLAAGVLVPILLFLIPFALRGALRDFVSGVIIGSAQPREAPPVLPAAAFGLLAGRSLPDRARRRLSPAFPVRRHPYGSPRGRAGGGAVAVRLLVSVYRLAWYSMRSLGVTVVLAACLRLADAHRQGFWSSETRQKIFLLAAVVMMTSLVQFPFAAPFYFFYFAPFVALAVFALVGSEPRPPWPVHAAMFAFYLLFALLRTNTGYIFSLGNRFVRFDPPAVLDLPRAGGLRVGAEDVRLYSTVDPAGLGEERREAHLRRPRRPGGQFPFRPGGRRASRRRLSPRSVERPKSSSSSSGEGNPGRGAQSRAATHPDASGASSSASRSSSRIRARSAGSSSGGRTDVSASL